MQMPREVGHPGIGELLDENLVAGLRERHQRKKNRVLATAGHDDAIDRRVEAGPADPRRSGGAVVPRARMMLIAEYPRARRSRNRRGQAVGELLHVRKRHQRVDGEIEHALLRPFDLQRAGPHERAASHFAAQQTATLRLDVRARHGRERHAELAREHALRRQAAAGLQPPRFDLAADRIGNGLVDRTAALPPRRQLDCHACNMSLDCLQCQDTIHSIGKAWRQSLPVRGGHRQVRHVRAERRQTASSASAASASRCRSSRSAS